MSISSSLITNLTQWRNPQGAEENWKGRESRYVHLPSFKKIAVSEIGFALVGIAAIVESVVNAAFVVFSLPFLFISPDATKLSVERLKSSTFVVGWGAVDLVLNLGISNLTTKEETARAYAHNLHRSFTKQIA
jgi:hypothetical protein